MPNCRKKRGKAAAGKHVKGSVLAEMKYRPHSSKAALNLLQGQRLHLRLTNDVYMIRAVSAVAIKEAREAYLKKLKGMG